MKFILSIIAFLFVSYANANIDTSREALIRVFKKEKELELWIKNGDKFTLYKKYKVCKLSGKFGPKREEGDLQVPEGIYEVNVLNPHSNYKKSIGINYPNKSDSILSQYAHKGGLIFIHGNCVSIGCVAIGDQNIEELYRLVSKYNKTHVHIFPARFDESNEYVEKNLVEKPELTEFELDLYQVYLYFNQLKVLPKIEISDAGRYIIE